MPGRRRHAPASAADRLVVCELGPPHGVRGEIMGRLSGLGPDELLAIEELWLQRGKEDPVRVRVLGARPKKGDWILDLGLTDRHDAERHRGAVLLARRSDLPEPAPGEWYVADLVGTVVVTEDGEELGTLEEVLTLPANDVAVVRGERGEILVPLLEHVVRELDGEAGRMTVRLPKGLLEAEES